MNDRRAVLADDDEPVHWLVQQRGSNMSAGCVQSLKLSAGGMTDS